MEDINKIVKSLSAKKEIGAGGIPFKLVKFSATVVHNYLTSIINHDISQFCSSDGVKNAIARPIY